MAETTKKKVLYTMQMDVLSKKEIESFQKEILDWYEKNKRDLPWREVPVGTSLDQKAYRILVSEIMLQQTQVSRVIPKYEAWLKEFPTVEILARATTTDVLRLWSGLGYNRRALYLQKCAKAVVETYNGTFPKDIDALKKLPGIGEYTAAALACFAFDQQVAVVDTNVRKVILVRFADVMLNLFQHLKRDKILKQVQDDTIKKTANQILPKGKAYEWNQALMDYASAMLKKEKIPLVKQSAFKDSNRYYRGQIIKLLLEQKETTREALIKLFEKDSVFIDEIVKGLVQDRMIIQKGEKITLSN